MSFIRSKLLKWGAVLVLWWGGSVFALSLQEGKDYTILPINVQQKESSNKNIQVLEFFSYTCIHCYNLEPVLSQWTHQLRASSQYRDVEFRREQVNFGQQTNSWVRLYQTIRGLPQSDALHAQIFRAVMDQKIKPNNPEAFKGWLLAKPEFKDLIPTINLRLNDVKAQSEALKTSNDLTRLYQIDATPPIVVGGKYKLTPAEPARLLAVASALIEKVRQERNGKPAKS